MKGYEYEKPWLGKVKKLGRRRRVRAKTPSVRLTRSSVLRLRIALPTTAAV